MLPLHCYYTSAKFGNQTPGQSKKQKAEAARPERKSNAVYVTSLPDDATVDELKGVFSRYGGVIAESADTGEPRIKIYVDDDGQPKGDALVVFFRPESVQLAIDMLDETEFRPGERSDKGPMRVTVADQSYKQQKDQPLKSDQAKKKGTGANKDRDKIIKKNQELNRYVATTSCQSLPHLPHCLHMLTCSSRLADWDDDDPQALPDTSSRWDKVVVLKHMFTPEELKADPVAVLDIKEDVREEAEKLGEVTNVVLYDKEEDGTVTVRFSDATAAKACVRVFNGRNFDERTVSLQTVCSERDIDSAAHILCRSWRTFLTARRSSIRVRSRKTAARMRRSVVKASAPSSKGRRTFEPIHQITNLHGRGRRI